MPLLRLDKEPEVRVGIMTAPRISVHYPADAPGEFMLDGVTIGKQFHWQRTQNQRFRGSLELLRHPDGTTTAINRVGVEEYLRSVIGSEMNASSPLELLKAHAVISRSWLLAQMRPDLRHNGEIATDALDRVSTSAMLVDWQDHQDHTGFDVCADDHCQRYQGIPANGIPAGVEQAINLTAGEVLTFDNLICDTRFSKCCGGMTEDFAVCWEPHSHPYLTPVHDPYCSEATPEILAITLNGYDREDTDTYRWQADYAPGELEQLLTERSGIDFGEVTALRPLRRGISGRIHLLEIIGTKTSRTIGKELTIRRWLSKTHLKSSAFNATRRPDGGWTLNGRGWGHGVGLCQMGAAVMACKGFSYKEILSHYYPNAIIRKIY